MQRLAYISTIIRPTSGTLNKLERQAKTAARADIPFDIYWTGKDVGLDWAAYPHLKLEFLDDAGPFSTRARQAKRVNDLLAEYDKVVLRYPQWDPVLQLMIQDKKRVVLELHTRYLTERLSEGSWRYWPERLFSSWMRAFGGLSGVSPEIVASEAARAGFTGPTIVIPNSIDLAGYTPGNVPVWPKGERLKLIMVASQFYPWQGLELILGEMSKDIDKQLELHLVGQLSDEQQRLAEAEPNVIIHGSKPAETLKAMYQEMHAGLSFFNLGVKEMTSTSALKVCEYLASGLAVISAHHDSALPENFKYELVTPRFDPKGIYDFMTRIRDSSRQSVQDAARPYIDSLVNTKRLYDFCVSLPPADGSLSGAKASGG